MRNCLSLLLPLLLSPLACAQFGTGASPQQDEFPALQFLPEGSEVIGITIPRYEKHRATSLLKADKMKVLSRTVVQLSSISAFLYGEGGISTRIFSIRATYDFKTCTATADSHTEVEDPRFSATGKSASYSTKTSRGVLRGPVYTTVSTESFSPDTGKP